MKVIKSNNQCVIYTTAPRVTYTSNGFVVATFNLSAKTHNQEELERFIEAVMNVGADMKGEHK